MYIKLVNESLFEFKKGMDPVESLGMGRYKLIKDWLDEFIKSYSMYNSITDTEASYHINDDYTIDFYGDFDISVPIKPLTTFPEFIEFNYIDGMMSIGGNKFTSLRGCPKEVSRYFLCYNNKLSSLEFSPSFVGEEYNCKDNLVQFTKEDVRQVCDVKGAILC